jgi:hypothetical protein
VGRFLRVPFLKKEEIEEKASAFLARHLPRGIPPVPIEEILEIQMGVDIVPVRGLRDSIDKDGFVSSDMTTVSVDFDQYNLSRLEPRYRFTLAHEVGHIVLHRHILTRFSITGVSEWKVFVDGLSEEAWARFEFQANWFAGHVLVPSIWLKDTAEKNLPGVIGSVEKAQKAGLSRKDYIDYAVERWVRKISPRFHVSSEVARIRLESEGLIDRIP